MADQDEKAAETNPDGSPKKDLRYSSHEDRNVRVDRELDGSGHLARGDVTKMSVLNFSSRHQSRTERDPDFTFRPAPAAPPPTEPAAEAPTMVDKIKHFFGL